MCPSNKIEFPRTSTNYVWLQHVTHVKEACHTCTSHVTYAQVVSRSCNDSSVFDMTSLNVTQFLHKHVISRTSTNYVRTRHVTHINEACHVCMSRVTHVKRLICIWRAACICDTILSYKCHFANTHQPHVNEACHTYTWVMSHMHGSRHVLNDSFKRVVPHTWRDPCIHLYESFDIWGGYGQ